MKFSLRILFFAVSIACVLCAIGVRYYTTRRPLTIWLRDSNQSFVEGGKVFLNGQLMGETPLTIHESDITKLGYRIIQGKSSDWRYGRTLVPLGVLLNNIADKDGKSPLLWIDAAGEEPGKYETARSAWGRSFVDGHFDAGLKDVIIRRSPLDEEFPIYRVQIDSAKLDPDSETIEVRFSCRMDQGSNIQFSASVTDISHMPYRRLDFETIRVVDRSSPSIHQFAGKILASQVRPYSYLRVHTKSASPRVDSTHSGSSTFFIDGMK